LAPASKKPRKTTSKRSSPRTVDSGINKDAANRVYAFFEKVLKHSKGEQAGKPFTLMPWQQYVLGEIFGRLKPDGTRQYRQAYIEIPKKNGKSTLLAGISLYVLLADGEQGAEVYGAASDREQAGIIYREAAAMVRSSPSLSKVLEVVDSRKSIIHKASNSFYRVLSADAFRAEGLNIHCLLFDELHAQRGDRRLWDALRYGGAARRQPLVLSITTAGEANKTHLWYEQHDYAERCIADKTFDPAFFGCIYAADREDDWQKPKIWKKANPSLGETISEESFASDCREAANSATKLSSFLRYRLNIPTTTETRWVRPDQIAACMGEYSAPLANRECWCGLDLASTFDTTAFVAWFPGEDGIFDVYAHFWMPAENASEREKTDRVPYSQWQREGWLTLTDGKSTDYGILKRDIMAFCDQHTCRSLAIDRWNATMLAQELAAEGLPVAMFGQGFASMSSPTKALEAKLVDGTLRLNGNALLSWQLGNAAVQMDPAGNVKLSKAKSTERIDGAVALAMSCGVHMGESMAKEQMPEISFW
jgi:phage terminase large subunit-like protein